MLSDTKLRTLKPKDKAYRVTDERGLYVQVSVTGAKLWRFKYKFDGKEKLLALGQYPDVPLTEARRKRDEARQQVALGIDPSGLRRAEKSARGDIFGALFEEWQEERKATCAAITISKDESRANNHILPYLRDVKDPNGTAYNRTQFLSERHKLMQVWADWLWEIGEIA